MPDHTRLAYFSDEPLATALTAQIVEGIDLKCSAAVMSGGLTLADVHLNAEIYDGPVLALMGSSAQGLFEAGVGANVVAAALSAAVMRHSSSLEMKKALRDAVSKQLGRSRGNVERVLQALGVS